MICMERKCIDKMITLNETSGKQGIQSYIADIEWNVSDYNDIGKGNAFDILMTLNETSGKQGIQSYIDDIGSNISDYNDIWKGNPSIYWLHWMKHQGNRESNHILLILNEI